MDENGNLLELPYSLTSSFARYVARNNISDLKRFCFDRVYRSGNSGPPKQFFECDFDIIHSSRSNFFYEAEILKVAQEALDTFPFLASSDYYFCLNHVSLIYEIFDFCGLGKDLHGKLFQIFARIGSMSLPKLQESLIELKIPQRAVESLSKLAVIEGS